MRIISILTSLFFLSIIPVLAVSNSNVLRLSGSTWQAIVNPQTGTLLGYTQQIGNDSWCIPFQTELNAGPAFEGITLQPSPDSPSTFSGRRGTIRYELRYREEEDHLRIECRITNEGTTTHAPLRERLVLGVDSEMRSFPAWDEKFFPSLIRCERDFAWGYFMSPRGQILAFGVEEPTASYGLNYIFEGNKAWLWGHQIHTASLDFLHAPPLPARHPQHLTEIAPGESLRWTIHLGAVDVLEQVKPTLATWLSAPLLEARKYTLCSGEAASVKIHGTQAVSEAILHHPDGRTESLPATDENRLVTPPLREKGLYRITITAGGKQSEVSLYVRNPWSWYLTQARNSVAEHPPFFSASCETFYGYYPAFLAARHFPNPVRDKALEERFSGLLPQLIDSRGHPQEQANPRRIQNFSTLAGMLVDLWEATGNDTYLLNASRLGDFIASDSVQWSDGSYRSEGIHYTAVIYPAKSMFELADAELRAGWTDRARRHHVSAIRAAEDLRLRLDDIETEGDMTFEDGMITCSALQMALCGLHMPDGALRRQYAEAARHMMEKHRCLEQRLIPDCRMRGATLRYWEALDIYFSPNQAMNSPHGWTAWKIYAVCYLYLLTGEEHYLNELTETTGACVQLMDLDGRLRWGFIPDPYIEGLVCTPAADNPHERQMRDSVVGEQYLGMISPWLRPDDEHAFTRFGCPGGAGDNTVYEIFKALEECVLTTAYVIVSETGAIRAHNCSAHWTRPDRLHIEPAEKCIERIHLNIRKPIVAETRLQGKSYRQRAASGMSWIGTDPYPKVRR